MENTGLVLIDQLLEKKVFLQSYIFIQSLQIFQKEVPKRVNCGLINLNLPVI